MDNNDETGSKDDPLISREHVQHILRRAGVGDEQIAEVLDGLEFPSPLSKILARALQHGISGTSLTDRMGGSP
jgi:ABC-type taurine transport system substrate-binding protein